MLMARVFSYPDAQRYRVGTNYLQLPVNAPREASVATNQRDGAMSYAVDGGAEDPHTLAREMVVTMVHPVEGAVRALGIPIKLSGTPGAIRRPAPLLGEHTDELLAEAGFTSEEARDLRKGGVIA